MVDVMKVPWEAPFVCVVGCVSGECPFGFVCGCQGELSGQRYPQELVCETDPCDAVTCEPDFVCDPAVADCVAKCTQDTDCPEICDETTGLCQGTGIVQKVCAWSLVVWSAAQVCTAQRTCVDSTVHSRKKLSGEVLMVR